MCGIAGVVGGRGDEERARVVSMVEGLRHRGPDGSRVVAGSFFAVGTARLAIMDPAGGDQPMEAEPGCWIAYNGECYDQAALRGELEAEGVAFRSRCDTEVVLRGWRRWGPDELLRRMDGIFAFCLVDEGRREVVLVRDALGVKPLYWTCEEGRLLFASECLPLLGACTRPARLRPEGLRSYLRHQFVADGGTMVEGLELLAPGHLLRWRDGEIELRRWWRLEEEPADGPSSEDGEEELRSSLRSRVEEAVESRMMSDVGVACFLSGGLDSSIVAAVMARRAEGPVRAFSIAFPEAPLCDERPHAETVARALGLALRVLPVGEAEMLAVVDEAVDAMDTPVADPALLPTYLLSRAAAAEGKVVLTGEGADELFAGYPYYRPFVESSLRRGWGRFRAARERELRREALRRRSGHGRIFLEGPASPLSGFPFALDDADRLALLAPALRPSAALLRAEDRGAEEAALPAMPTDPLPTALAVDLRLWLARDLMMKIDKMSMRHGLEARVPFLRADLVRWAWRLPDSCKIRGVTGKWLLRQAFAEDLPPEILARPKHGFDVPLEAWFRGAFADELESTLRDSPHLREWIDGESLKGLLSNHRHFGVNCSRPLFMLFVLARWAALARL